LIDFDEIRTLELPPEATHHAKFNLYPTMRVVSANTQFATVTEKIISGVHVSSGTAESAVRRGEITNHHCNCRLFSERYLLSPVRLSVVCLSVTFVRPTQAVESFGHISTALGTLATH